MRKRRSWSHRAAGPVLGTAVAALALAHGTTPPPAAPVAGTVAAARFDHRAWDRLLAAHVDSLGRVAYRDLQRRDLAALRAYLDSLAAARPETWPEAEQIAFWLDAYNAGMFWAVLQGQSAESLVGRARLFKTWKFRVAGTDRTPDEIEHDILRRRFAEPRIHFALVCASASCPPLRREAYVAGRLDAQLDEQARLFVGDPRRNVIDPEAKRLELSSIFDWFRTDFETSAGSLPAFLARYITDPAARDWLAGGTALPPRFLDYDWTLNAQPDQRPLRRRRGGS